jgi:hypothetical protein
VNHRRKTARGVFDWRGVTLVREDWDFTGCNDWERPACLEYELCREWTAAREKAVTFWKQFPGAKIENSWMGACALQGVPAAVLLPQFPGLPWLRIPKETRLKWILETRNVWLPHNEKKRQRMIAAKDFQPDAFTALDETAVENLKLRDVFQDCRFDYTADAPESFHVLRLNWSFSNKQLADQFARWVENRRPSDTNPVEKRGRTGDDKLLKAIGARRLLLAFGLAKAEAHTFDVLGNPLYSDATAWSRAKRTAESAILAAPR